LLQDLTFFLVFLPIGFLTGPIAIMGSFAARTPDKICVVVRHRHALDATHTRKGSLDGKNSIGGVHNACYSQKSKLCFLDYYFSFSNVHG
jgi:hypothetical protein